MIFWNFLWEFSAFWKFYFEKSTMNWQKITSWYWYKCRIKKTVKQFFLKECSDVKLKKCWWNFSSHQLDEGSRQFLYIYMINTDDDETKIF